MDIVFLMDSGPEISDADWNSMKNLLRDTAVTYLRPSTYGTHVAQVQFGGNVSVIHGLIADLVIEDRSRSLDAGRKVSNAIRTTRQLVLNNAGGDRPEVPDVMVLMTRGLADDSDDAVAAASRVKSDGIRIITVGITGEEIDKRREELRELATDPDDVDKLMLITDEHRWFVRDKLAQAMCRNRDEAAGGSLTRLVDGSSNTGRLEVYIQEEWATVSSYGWSNLNTIIACKQLGFPDGQTTYTVNQTFYHRRVGIANVRCSGNEHDILSCPRDPFFHIDVSSSHRRDVFLRCLCADCEDYSPRDNVRLADRTLISGRLEAFVPGIGWGGVCRSGWTANNTEVACRQLGFLGGARTYQPDNRQSITSALFNVSCSGNENSLFDCTYATSYSTASRVNCVDPIYIQCECNHCSELFLQEPGRHEVTSQSSVVFEWRFRQNVSAFEIVFLSQKNYQTLVHVEGETTVTEHTRFERRIQLVSDDHATVGFSLANVTTADMGIYELYVPELHYCFHAVLIVSDFAVAPAAVVRRQVGESVTLSWDLTALRQLRDIDHDVLLTTPTTGRLRLDYYFTHWLIDNPDRHRVTRPSDPLHLTIIIDRVTVLDAGNYVVEVMMTSSVYQWLNVSRRSFATDLVVTNTNQSPPQQTSNSYCICPEQTTVRRFQETSTEDYVRLPHQTSSTHNAALLVLTIIFAVLFVLSLSATVVLVFICRRRNRKETELTYRVGRGQNDGYIGMDEEADRRPRDQQQTAYTAVMRPANANYANVPTRPTGDSHHNDDFEETEIREPSPHSAH